ncbi:type VI secretion system-associated protein TagO, partial [Paenochrobactrum sp. BZR 588]|uniref:type VI secretion system-associated protein TagO n=1 Tax=unclassified Paenochrobactrum TaxID=2639760 RepID=UPI003854EB87
KTSLYINTGCHMTSSDYNDYGDVTYRLDSDKARKVGMAESTDNKALGLWSGGKSIPVIKQMLSKDEMVVRMTPYGQSPFTATFKIAGLSDAIKPLREECKW